VYWAWFGCVGVFVCAVAHTRHRAPLLSPPCTVHTVISALLHVRWLCAVREVAAVGRGVVGAHVCVWLATVHLGPSPLPSLPPSLRTPGVCIQQWVVCTVRGSEYSGWTTTRHPWGR